MLLCRGDYDEEEAALVSVYRRAEIPGVFSKGRQLNIYNRSDREDHMQQLQLSNYALLDRYHWKNSRFVAPIVLIARPGAVLLTVCGQQAANRILNLPFLDTNRLYRREFIYFLGRASLYCARVPAEYSLL